MFRPFYFSVNCVKFHCRQKVFYLPLSLDKMMETEDGSVFAIADPHAEFEKDIMAEDQIEVFKRTTLTDKDQEILQLRLLGHTEQEIADKVGYKTASAVHKRIAKIASIYEDFVTKEYQ